MKRVQTESEFDPASIRESMIQDLIFRAFEEDIKDGDVTTNAIVDESVQAEAEWQAKERGIIAGLKIARAAFQQLDSALIWTPAVRDGEEVDPGTVIVEMKGSCRAILTAERTALNMAQRMSGIATKTYQLVQSVSETDVKILDTRKTIPGLRVLDKLAVSTGGGENHRMGLFDMAMIKDNHIVAAGGIAQAVQMVRKQNSELKIEVETTTLAEVKEALKVHADIIMLDNMSPDVMKEAVSQIGNSAKTEASGNITEKNIKQIADTGVDYISIGALTHSVEAFDISQTVHKIF